MIDKVCDIEGCNDEVAESITALAENDNGFPQDHLIKIWLLLWMQQ